MRILIALLLAWPLVAMADTAKVIQLPYTDVNDVVWSKPETQFFAEAWGVEVISNIAKPSLHILQPAADTANGKAVVIAPGGALYYSSINSEGIDVAKWLAQQGFVAAVLKYRLVPTSAVSVEDLAADQQDRFSFFNKVTQVMPLSVKDGLEAIRYLKTHHQDYGIDQDEIGIMGFSAGGALALGVAYNYDAANRPDFVVTVYPWTEFMPIRSPQDNSPPLLIICASDDQLGLAPGSINLYNAWYNAGLSAELHMYATGGHGFGMRASGQAKDSWIERFADWAKDL